MTMRFSQGERVTHPNKLDWGIGQVLDDSDKTVRVFFVGAGEKTLRLGIDRLPRENSYLVIFNFPSIT